jgi:hypothetical protein
MRRLLTVGGLLILMVFAGSTTALAAPVQAEPTSCPTGTQDEPAAGSGSTGREDGLAAQDGAGEPEESAGQDEPGGKEEPARDEPAPVEPVQGDDCVEAGGAQLPTGDGTTAAEKHGWGEPNRVEEFDGPLGEHWNVYDSPGHAGNGRRTPEAISIDDGILTITGDSEGNTAGMAWGPGQKYGRWEGRVRAPASDESYNALLLLWPDAENFPVGGEIDFMEMIDHTRQTTNIFLHYGPDNSQISGEVRIDGTKWHNWAVEWTPTHVAAFVDGKEWWRTTRSEILPPGPMHLCIQLDWFPENGVGQVQESYMYVDWVKRYPLDLDDAIEDAVDDTVEEAFEDIEGVEDTVRDTVDDAVEGAVDGAGGATAGDVEEAAGEVVEGVADAAADAAADVVDGLTGPLTEGRPDPVLVRPGPVDEVPPTGD